MPDRRDLPTRIRRRRGLIWNGSTPFGQRFFGIDFGPFAFGVLLDGPTVKDVGDVTGEDAFGV